ncbi:hypothetical protein BC939DRAFT_474432 [Gamsiella multidivaricata]|uniref:uncharacterized protein n=1 Tax=Gamsiella multidivaricata TaxID=101098 RepID=UPI002220DAC9|nr:uncharacterized protein BC939DRAFT_474432 [Gamsiella multidivaricata]KAI7828905.1 hypothetical protein BC939DRAFT_474432 [Gamsiella multidivaricata]
MVNRMSIIRLTLDGSLFKEPLHDVYNNGCGFDPIVPLLEALIIDSALSSEKKSAKSEFRIFLKYCTSVNKLNLRSDDRYLLLNFIKAKIGLFLRLKKMTLNCKERTIAIGSSKGKTHRYPKGGPSASLGLEVFEDKGFKHLDIVNIKTNFPDCSGAPTIPTDIAMRAVLPVVRPSYLWKAPNKYGLFHQTNGDERSVQRRSCRPVENEDGGKRPRFTSLMLLRASLTLEGLQRMRWVIGHSRNIELQRSQRSLEILVDKVPGNKNSVAPLKTLRLEGMKLAESTNPKALWSLLATLEGKVPDVSIEGL